MEYIFLIVFLYIGNEHIACFGNAAADNEYEDIQKEFTRPVAKPEGPTPEPEAVESPEEGSTRLIEDAEPPLEVDWDELKSVNSDIRKYIPFLSENLNVFLDL